MLQSFNIPAGGRQIDAKASFFRYESAAANGSDETIRVRADGNDLGTYLPGDSIRLPIDATRWEIVPVTLTATCIVRLGIGQVDSARLLGVVQVIDTNKAKTIAGKGFTNAASRGAPGAGQYARCGVYNGSAAGGTRLVVEKLQFATTGAATTFYVGFVNGGAGLGAFAANKLASGADSTVARITQDNTGAPATLTNMLMVIPNTASGPISFPTPMVVMPGWSLVVTISTANQDCFLTTEHTEEPIT